jgi:hypothetical protein
VNAWLTPDEPQEPDVVCLALLVPRVFREHVMGALGELTEIYNWEQEGSYTPEECADIMAAMWEAIEECVP